MQHASLLISEFTASTSGRGNRKLPPQGCGLRDQRGAAAGGLSVVIHQWQDVFPWRCHLAGLWSVTTCSSITERADMTSEPGNQKANIRIPANPAQPYSSSTEAHQKEHLGLFLPLRRENRPLANLQTRRDLCCQSRNPQIILVQNGLFSKTGSFS